MSPRVTVMIVALVVAVGAVVGARAWSQANDPLALADLRADPAFALRMPEAEELAQVGGEDTVGIDGSRPAFAGHIYGTAATSADVYGFYERELGRLGWRPETPPYSRSTAELENRLYCESKISFRLAIKNKATAFEPAFYRGRSYATVFDARLIAADPKATCPRPGT